VGYCQDVLDDIRKSVRLLSPALRRRWALMVPLALVAAVAEAIGAAAVFVFLQVIAAPDEIPQVAGLPVLVTWFEATAPPSRIQVGAILLVGLYLLRSGLLATVAYLQIGTVQKSIAEVSRRLFWGYLTVPYRFHLGRNSATLIQEVRDSVDATYELVLASAVQVASETLIALGLIVILASVAPGITLVAALLTVSLLLLPNPLTRHFFARSGHERQRLEQELYLGLQQSLGALREVKLAGRERFFDQWVAERRQAIGQVQHHRAALDATLRLLVETAFLLVMLLVVVLVTLTLGPGPEVMSLVGLFAYSTFRLVPSTNRITLQLSNIRFGRAYVRSLYDDFVEVTSTPGSPAGPATEPRLSLSRAIVMERVSFAYAEQREHAVIDVTLTINRGDSIGIVGRTGAGKSTLVNLLLGLLEPTGGRITCDGRDIRDQLRAWQASIGYVPQEFFVFDDTLRRNIALGVADEAIDAHRLGAAVRVAQLEELVASLPNGLESAVGERGIRLSGGERQRLAIARALYREPDVLVFDEATAAVDTITEGEVVRAIESLHGEKTLIVIAHRFGTVARCDRIIVMDAGRIVAEGSCSALLREHATFRALAGLGAP